MDREENYSTDFTGLDYSLENQHHHTHHRIGESSSAEHNNNNGGGDGGGGGGGGTLDFMIDKQQQEHHQQQQFFSSALDKMNFADVMQFADFGPKLGLNQTNNIQEEEETGNIGFLKFPVLNQQPLVREEDEEARVSDNNTLGDQDVENKNGKNKRKRPRTLKTTEEVESQRMTHIAVERNRRKQMNEHLRVLRSLMPGSYVQRGDQASIIGGAIEFVRELEQLLQCLESQKRRRILGDSSIPINPQPGLVNDHNHHHQMKDFECEETAENKSCFADVEVKLLGFDAIIKILSRRRPGQLIKTIAALQDLQLTIVHTNITSIEQTVLYSFNVKVSSETRFSAEDIASSVQQIFGFIHSNTNIS